MEQILFRAMGCEIFCGIDSTHPRIYERLRRVPAMFETWEQTLSRFRPDSELSQLNAHAGETIRVTDTLWRVLQLAQRAQEMSDGLVVPTMLDALIHAGYDRPFDALQKTQRAQFSTQTVVTLPKANAWQLHPATHSVTFAPDTHLDLNGVAKGWAIEQAAAYLGELGPALVDAGGDMVITAPRASGESWILGIEDAFDPEKENDALPMLSLTHGATATSGRSFRKWVREGKPMHHLIDPRIGLPAETDVMNASVIASTILEAEVAAKVALILGSEKGMEWIETRPPLAALLILENGDVVKSSQMEKFIL